MAEEARHSMSSDELARVAHLCIDTCFGVRAGEQVLVVADDAHVEETAALTRAARDAGCEPVTVILPERDRYAKEPQPAVVAAMKASAVVAVAMRHELSVPFIHSVGTRSAIDGGARVGLFWTTPETSRLTAEDIRAIRRVSDQLAEALRSGSEVRVTTAAGTDVRVPVAGRKVFAISSLIDQPGQFCTIPYFGEAAVAPVEGETEGTIVVDAYMHWVGKIEEPIRLQVSRGRVVAIEGGAEAQRLREIVEKSDAQATNIAELGIGSCALGEPRGVSQDKAILGTAHLAIGHNHLLAGSIVSNIHLDGVFRKATIAVDGRVIMREGQLLGS